VQPVYDVGGDAFDYAISETTLSLAIFDANGHDLAAGLTVATAVAAYRNSRRAGQTLSEQTAAVDKMVAYHSQMGEHFVTGVLAELDLHTGRLRYVVAGHPAPLLVRNGRVVKRLDHMHRMLFGVAHPTFEIAEEVLEAGDSLLLFTDGIPEARDAQGRFFGEDRLVDFLQRETLAGEPPPETLRRLSRAIMAHQADVLQDDATVVLARWQPNGSIGLLQ
jgi:serine phosphatase RsbU (regulator of sigma subunit)